MALTRRQRARLSRGVQYGIAVALVLVVAVAADWEVIRRTFFNLDVAVALFPTVITTALANTLLFTVLGFAVALALGLVLALMRLSSVGVYRWVAGIYIEFFRVDESARAIVRHELDL